MFNIYTLQSLVPAHHAESLEMLQMSVVVTEREREKTRETDGLRKRERE